MGVIYYEISQDDVDAINGWTKACTKCGIEKLVIEFSRRCKGRPMRSSMCQSCKRLRNASHQQTPKFKVWRQGYEKTPERMRRRNERGRSEIYREKDRKASPKYNAQRREHYKANPHIRIKQSIKQRVLKTLKGIRKTQAKALDLLGCSIEMLWKHLESTFRKGMTRENYGSFWEIDHIIPCIEFDLENPEEQKRCFHYSNLRALLISKNRSKGRKIDLPQQVLMLPPTWLT
jgi:hypothetical protein